MQALHMGGWLLVEISSTGKAVPAAGLAGSPVSIGAWGATAGSHLSLSLSGEGALGAGPAILNRTAISACRRSRRTKGFLAVRIISLHLSRQ
jgi:hypothetical protein